MFDRLLSVLLDNGSVSREACKTRRLIFNVFQAQDLSTSVISKFGMRLTLAIRLALEGGENEISLKFAALKVIYLLVVIFPLAQCFSIQAFRELVRAQTTSFVPVFSELLPTILSLSFSGKVAMRTHAVHALSSLAFAILESSDVSQAAVVSLSAIVKAFIQENTGADSTSQPDLESLKTCWDRSSNSQSSKGAGSNSVVWGITTLSSLIVLAGHTVFLSPSYIRFFLNILGTLRRHKEDGIRSLHPYVWRCLVYAWAKLPSHTDVEKTVKAKAFNVIKQELRRGNGVAIVSAALYSSSNGSEKVDLGPMLDLIKTDLIGEKKFNPHLRNDGLSIFRVLLGVKPTVGRLQSPSDIVAKGLLNGSLLESSIEDFPDITSKLSVAGITLLRPLSETEIQQHWTALLVLWEKVAHISLGSGGDPSETSEYLGCVSSTPLVKWRKKN